MSFRYFHGWRKGFSFFLCGIFVFSGLTSSPRAEVAIRDTYDSRTDTVVTIFRGDVVNVKVYSLTRIAVTNPGIVDIKEATIDNLMLVGRTVGSTPLFIWDEYGKRKVEIRVFSEDLDIPMARTQELLAAARIQGIELSKDNFKGKIVATGFVTKEELDVFKNEIMSEVGEALFVNMVREIGDLIQIDVQVSELTTTLSKTLGFDWTNSGGSSLTLTYAETLPTFDGSVGDFFKIGDFARTSALQATVNALIQEGKGRVLSKPSLIVKNGEEASFLVGGEIPIRTTTSGVSGAVQENVTFKEYGVEVSVQPEIINGKIDMTVDVEIREIDAANAVGDDVAFTNRTAQTRVFLDDGQTIVIAGLIRQTKDTVVKKVPLLGSIPIIGALFRSKSNPTSNQDQEVVISLTPRIVRQSYPGYDRPEPMKDHGKEPAEPLVMDVVRDEQKNLTTLVKEVLGEEEAKEILGGTAAQPEEPSESGVATSSSSDLGEIDRKEKAEAPASAASLEKNDDLARVVAPYVKAIQKTINDNISFPYEAKEKGWKGTVVLELTLDAKGILKDVRVKESSGHEVFDKDAVNTAQILSPYDPFPAELDLQEIQVTVPVVYSPEALLSPSSQE